MASNLHDRIHAILKTLGFPPNSKLDPAQIAPAGFAYSNYEAVIMLAVAEWQAYAQTRETHQKRKKSAKIAKQYERLFLEIYKERHNLNKPHLEGKSSKLQSLSLNKVLTHVADELGEVLSDAVIDDRIENCPIVMDDDFNSDASKP
jgi:hypothetical protein